jgi:hypothetical protein
VDANLTNPDGEVIPVVMIRDGGSLRMEFNDPSGASTLITNAQTGESFILSNQGGQTIAIRAAGLGQGLTNPIDQWQGDLAQTATRTGSCSVAGQSGDEWTKTTEADGTDTVCVTEDGVILRATDDGRVVWETTDVQRGPQSADAFTLPQGVQVMDLGNMGGMLDDAMEAAKQRGN